MLDTSSMLIWMATLTIGVCGLILAAGSGAPETYMAVTACISLVLAALGVRDLTGLSAGKAPLSALSASAARHMGLVWAWGALALFVTYYFILDPWKEWPVFFSAFAIVAAISLLFAAAMTKDAERGTEDATLLKIGRILTLAQLAGTIVAVIGLLIDPDKQFLNTARKDWAAQTVFLFGAIALAILSTAALLHTRERKAAA